MQGRWTIYHEEPTCGSIAGPVGNLLAKRLRELDDRPPRDLYGLVIDDSWEDWLRGAAAATSYDIVTTELTRIADVLAAGHSITFESADLPD